MNKEEFIKELKKIGIILDNNQIEKLELFYNLLVEENKITNLTRITEKEDVYLKHFYDSLTLIKAINLNENIKLCDIGTGAGFPGIVLKIAFPNIEIVLVDSLNKRINFLNKVIEKLNLNNIITIHERAEIYSKKNIETFDYVTSRAVARSEILIEIGMPLLKVGGHLILMKANCDDEIDALKKITNKYNAKINTIIKFELPNEKSARTIIDLKKENKTSKQYPRSIDKIKKENLK